MRAMAFSATITPILSGTKTCTRREASSGAARLHPGSMIRAVDQLMGLGNGKRARTLAVLRVVNVTPAPRLTAAEVAAEGFEDKPPAFVESVLRSMYGDVPLVRVGFVYVAIAAPRLAELTNAQPLLALTREVGLAATSGLAALRRGEAACADLKALRDLAARDVLLEPEAHRRVCVELNVSPMELWRPPRAPRRRAQPEDEGQRDLFA